MKSGHSASKRVFIAALALLPLWAGAQAPANPAAAPPFFVVVPPGSPYTSLGGLIASAQRAPGTVVYGTGPATKEEAMAFMERRQTGMVIVPYRGSQLAVNDMLAGQLQAAVVPNQLAQQLIAEGKVRSLGTISADGNTSGNTDLPPPPPVPVTGTSG